MAAVMSSFPVSDIIVPDPRAAGIGQVPEGAASMAVQHLPFTVRLVRTEDELAKAVAVRHAAYARHLPVFAEQLKQPELSDFNSDAVVLLAESRLDGSPLGTMRIQTNRNDALPLEQSVRLPEWLHRRRLAEAVRLGIKDGVAGHLVKTVLFKAFYLYCVQSQVDWMVIAGRPPIDRQYKRLLFSDVFPELGCVPLKHAGNMPHRVMSLKVADVEPLWRASQHPLHDFFFHTRHPDIEIEQAEGAVTQAMQLLSVRGSGAEVHLAAQ